MTLRSAVACLAAFAALLSAFAGAWTAAATPEQVSIRLQASVEAGEVRQAWSLMRVEGPSGRSSLLTEGDLSRALQAAPGHRELVGAPVRNLAPAWDPAPDLQVVVAAQRVEVRLPQGYRGLKLDGRELPLKAGRGQFEVLPVWHRLTLAGGPMVAGYSEEVAPNASAWAPPTRFSSAGLRRLEALVTGALQACSASSLAAPPGCPQAALVPGGATGLAWRLLNPGPALSIAPVTQGGLTVEGSFIMVLDYRLPWSRATFSVQSAGTFAAPLQVGFDSLRLGPLAAVGAS